MLGARALVLGCEASGLTGAGASDGGALGEKKRGDRKGRKPRVRPHGVTSAGAGRGAASASASADDERATRTKSDADVEEDTYEDEDGLGGLTAEGAGAL